MSELQDIITAPKDGTKILVYGKWAGEIYGMSDEEGWFVASWVDRSYFPGFNWSIEGTDYAAAWCSAKHWAALPSITQPSSAASSSEHPPSEREPDQRPCS